MLALAAARLGMQDPHLLPRPESPAFEVTPHKTVAAYDDEAALAAFADAVDVVTYEFENVPAATAEFLARPKPLRPGANALAIVAGPAGRESASSPINGIPVAPFAPIRDARRPRRRARRARPARGPEDHAARLRRQGPARSSASRATAAAAFATLAPKPLVLEAFVPFEREISVVVARGLDGAVAAYDAGRERPPRPHPQTSTVPAAISPRPPSEARRHRRRPSSTRSTMSACSASSSSSSPSGDAAGQRDRAARPQFRPLDRGGLRHRPVRAAHPRRLPAGRWATRAGFADVVMENLIGDEVAAIPASLGAGHPAAALRQGRVAPGPQDGPHQPDRRRKRRENSAVWPPRACGQSPAAHL